MFGMLLPPLPPEPLRSEYRSDDDFRNALLAHRAQEHQRHLAQVNDEATQIVMVGLLACLGLGGSASLLFASGGDSLVVKFVGGLFLVWLLALGAHRYVRARIAEKRGVGAS